MRSPDYDKDAISKTQRKQFYDIMAKKDWSGIFVVSFMLGAFTLVGVWLVVLYLLTTKGC